MFTEFMKPICNCTIIQCYVDVCIYFYLSKYALRKLGHKHSAISAKPLRDGTPFDTCSLEVLLYDHAGVLPRFVFAAAVAAVIINRN